VQEKEEHHEMMLRHNSAQNPIILNGATILRQPFGLPFNAQLVLNVNQAKILVKFIERLQTPIEQTITNPHYRKDPFQLPLFQEDAGSSIQLDFELSEFGVNKVNYLKLKQDFLSLKNFNVVKDTIYYNKLINERVEASELKNLISSVILPKKYERYISVRIDKDVAKLLVNVGELGYTKYLLEVAMSSTSKYTLLVYQLISSWKEKGGFKWTIEYFKKYLGISDKYDNWKDLNARVIRPAYEELFEKADIWFEYKMEKKDKKPYMLNVKIVQGYYKVSEDFDSNFQDVTHMVDYALLDKKAKDALDILKKEILINDLNLSLEIITEKLDDFYLWYKANKGKLDTINNPAGSLLYYLKMTTKQRWKPRRWDLMDGSEKMNSEPEHEQEIKDYSATWIAIVDKLKNVISQQEIEIWFSIVSIGELTDNEIIFNLPSTFVYETIENKYSDLLHNAVKDHFGKAYTIKYRVEK
jgi:hypothetical protein